MTPERTQRRDEPVITFTPALDFLELDPVERERVLLMLLEWLLRELTPPRLD